MKQSQLKKELKISQNSNYYIISITLSKVKFEPLFEGEINIDNKNSFKLENPEIGHSYKINENTNIIDVFLMFKSKLSYENDLLYDIEIIFSAKSHCSDLKNAVPGPEDFAVVNAPAHIYPYIRQYFHQLLITSGLPAIILPPLIIRNK